MAEQETYQTHGSSNGPAVDRNQNPVIDPTKNVLDLVEAKSKAGEELRERDKEFYMSLRSADLRRIDDLRTAEIHRVDQQSQLRADFQEKLAIAESKRIDAIRAVDVAAVATASERAAQQATVLATQLATSAETLRALVASTAAQVATQLQQITTQFTERLSLLEKAQYESKGRSGVSDPQMEKLAEIVERLAMYQSQSSGKHDGINAVWGVILGGVGLIAALVAILYKVVGNN